MRSAVYAICGILILAATCAGQQAPVGAATSRAVMVSQDGTSSGELDSFAAQIAQQIMKKHLKSVAVFGAVGTRPSELTEDGKAIGDEISAALAKTANAFQVVDRATLRDFVKKNGVSEAMVVSDALANWIGRKAGIAGYVVLRIGEVSNGRVRAAAELFKPSGYDGDSLGKVKTELELSADQKRMGFRLLDSDWNKPTISESEAKKLPPERSPHCVKCSPPEFTDALRRGTGRNAYESVAMYVTVFPDARVGDVAVVKPGPFGMTIIAVETILQKWHFAPASDGDGKPMAFRTMIEIRYQTY
jgi:hypothetical protein